QAFESSLVNVQPFTASHASSVHGLPSLQTRGGPLHVPFWHVSVPFGPVQALPSSHDEPFGFFASGGQLPAPSHISAASHWAAAERQVTVMAEKFGRHVPDPSQVSGLLHTVLV